MTPDELNERSAEIARQAEGHGEPWHTSDDQKLCRYGQYSVHSATGEGVAYEISRPEFAARIVACVNKLAAFPDLNQATVVAVAESDYVAVPPSRLAKLERAAEISELAFDELAANTLHNGAIAVLVHNARSDLAALH